MTQLRYTIPLIESLEAGVYWLWSTSRLGKEYKALHVKGKSEIGGAFINFPIIDTDNVDLRGNVGFDYKHINNYTNEIKTSRDEARVVKAGFDLDVTDKWGRTVVTLEEDVGICGGDLHKKDPAASIVGSGSEFGKLVGNLFRLKPMPFNSSILWKNSFQATNYNMLSVEQFQVGGITSVRAYEPAEYSGDSGYSTNFEWSFPPYGFPKDLKVPYSKAKFYDATRFSVFYDLGYVHIRNPQTPEKKNTTVQGWGIGFRFNLPEDFFIRLDVAYRIDRKATFDSARGYMDIGKKF
jgi:hemolysin activation/secretion protein